MNPVLASMANLLASFPDAISNTTAPLFAISLSPAVTRVQNVPVPTFSARDTATSVLSNAGWLSLKSAMEKTTSAVDDLAGVPLSVATTFPIFYDICKQEHTCDLKLPHNNR